MTVSGNTVTNTFGQGIQFSASENANFTVAFDDNTSSYNEDAAFSFSTSDVATVCLEMSGNNFNPGYSISYYSTGAFTFAPCDYETVNTGSFSFSGGPVTYIESCPDGAPCP